MLRLLNTAARPREEKRQEEGSLSPGTMQERVSLLDFFEAVAAHHDVVGPRWRCLSDQVCVCVTSKLLACPGRSEKTDVEVLAGLFVESAFL